jgi:zinc protease
MSQRLFRGLGSRKTPGGRIAVVRASTPDKLREWQREFIVPNNSALVVTGDVDPADIFKQAAALYGDWPRGDDAILARAVPQFEPLETNIGAAIEQPVQNVVAQFGWQGPSVGKDTAATYAADVFSYILTQPNSRFQRALVDSGLSTTAGFGYYTQRYVGPITLIMQTSPEKARAAIKAAKAELARFSSANYFTDEELENAKAYLAADDLFSREKTTEYTHTLSFWWASTGADYFRGYQSELARVSRADIIRYVKEYIEKPRVVLVMLAPDAQAQLKLAPEELAAP